LKTALFMPGLSAKRLVCAATLLMGAALTIPAFAQVRVTSSDKMIFPPGLKWERMRTVILDPSSATKESPMVPVRPEDINAAKRIWADQVAAATGKGKTADFDSQISTVSYKGTPLAFSLIALPMDFERCEQALNGKNVVDVYAKCLARVALGNMQNPYVVEFSGFCYADSVFSTPEELQFRDKTQNQFAFDEKQGVAYFRLLQHGKFVPTCNRMIQLEGL
jgi:hypothetical protein